MALVIQVESTFLNLTRVDFSQGYQTRVDEKVNMVTVKRVSGGDRYAVERWVRDNVEAPPYREYADYHHNYDYVPYIIEFVDGKCDVYEVPVSNDVLRGLDEEHSSQ